MEVSRMNRRPISYVKTVVVRRRWYLLWLQMFRQLILAMGSASAVAADAHRAEAFTVPHCLIKPKLQNRLSYLSSTKMTQNMQNPSVSADLVWEITRMYLSVSH